MVGWRCPVDAFQVARPGRQGSTAIAQLLPTVTVPAQAGIKIPAKVQGDAPLPRGAGATRGCPAGCTAAPWHGGRGMVRGRPVSLSSLRLLLDGGVGGVGLHHPDVA